MKNWYANKIPTWGQTGECSSVEWVFLAPPPPSFWTSAFLAEVCFVGWNLGWCLVIKKGGNDATRFDLSNASLFAASWSLPRFHRTKEPDPNRATHFFLRGLGRWVLGGFVCVCVCFHVLPFVTVDRHHN